MTRPGNRYSLVKSWLFPGEGGGGGGRGEGRGGRGICSV